MYQGILKMLNKLKFKKLKSMKRLRKRRKKDGASQINMKNKKYQSLKISLNLKIWKSSFQRKFRKINTKNKKLIPLPSKNTKTKITITKTAYNLKIFPKNPNPAPWLKKMNKAPQNGFAFHAYVKMSFRTVTQIQLFVGIAKPQTLECKCQLK